MSFNELPTDLKQCIFSYWSLEKEIKERSFEGSLSWELYYFLTCDSFNIYTMRYQKPVMIEAYRALETQGVKNSRLKFYIKCDLLDRS